MQVGVCPTQIRMSYDGRRGYGLIRASATPCDYRSAPHHSGLCAVTQLVSMIYSLGCANATAGYCGDVWSGSILVDHRMLMALQANGLRCCGVPAYLLRYNNVPWSI